MKTVADERGSMVKRSRGEWFVILFALLCVLLLPVGNSLNALVIEANGGKMPVAVNSSDIFLRIGVRENDIIISPKEVEDGIHIALTQHSRLAILSDRIGLRLPDLGFLPRPILGYLNFKKYPAQEFEGLVSIGDLLLFGHAWLSPIATLLLLPYWFAIMGKRVLRWREKTLK